MRSRKIIMTVFCLEEDTEHLKTQLHTFFEGNNCPLAYFTVESELPTEHEELKAMEVFNHE